MIEELCSHAKSGLVDRFWKRVLKMEEGCWLYTGYIRPDGYGDHWLGCRLVRAHRVAYELEHGLIPDGWVVCHSCDNRACVRPDHLFVGTQRANIQDMWRKGRANLQTQGRPRGMQHGGAKLSDADVLNIRARGAVVSNRALAEEYGVDLTTISKIRKRHVWKHL